jgi:hypothetical protein
VLKAEPLLVTELVGSVDLTTHNDVYNVGLVLVKRCGTERLTLNANTKFSILVVAGLWKRVLVFIQADADQDH